MRSIRLDNSIPSLRVVFTYLYRNSSAAKQVTTTMSLDTSSSNDKTLSPSQKYVEVVFSAAVELC